MIARGDGLAGEDAAQRPSRWLLILLGGSMALVYVQMTAFGFAIPSIKRELGLSDAQIGFLTGLGFSAISVLIGLPIAARADRGNRINLLSISAVIGGIGGMLCGAAGGFLQLLGVRMGVSAFAAATGPISVSLIADTYPRAARPRATARLMLGPSVGIVIGSLGAGWLMQYWGWRAMLVIVGMLPIVLAMLCKTLLREPRTQAAASADPAPMRGSLLDGVRELWAIPAYRYVLIAWCVQSIWISSYQQWLPVILMRTYDVSPAATGIWLAVIALCSVIGTFLGGEFAARWAPGDEARQLHCIAIVLIFSMVIKASIFLSPDPYWVFGLMVVSHIVSSIVNGPSTAATQTASPPHLRALSFALVTISTGLIGAGLGPLATGWISDRLMPSFGDLSISYAIVLLSPVYIVVSGCFWAASRHVRTMGELS